MDIQQMHDVPRQKEESHHGRCSDREVVTVMKNLVHQTQ